MNELPKKKTPDLKRYDLIAHPNGQLWEVKTVKWVGGDNYRVDVRTTKGDKTFISRVHDYFHIAMSYSR